MRPDSPLHPEARGRGRRPPLMRMVWCTALAFGALGCGDRGGAANEPAAAIGPAGPSVTILSPEEGDTVSLPLTVRLSAAGVEVVAATGIVEPGKGHHHIILDEDAPPADGPIPAAAGFIHLGSGASELVLDSLPPGPHRLIAIFASGDHVPMPAVRTDTVRFVVR